MCGFLNVHNLNLCFSFYNIVPALRHAEAGSCGDLSSRRGRVNNNLLPDVPFLPKVLGRGVSEHLASIRGAPVACCVLPCKFKSLGIQGLRPGRIWSKNCMARYLSKSDFKVAQTCPTKL
jgi:hypothetical protein